jgi:hypothetical protein
MAYAYYIYYRVNPDSAEACASKVRALFTAVEQATGVQGRLLRKREEPMLWMEVYENVEDEARFEWELAEAVDRLKMQNCLRENTSRHTECFHA